MSDGDYDIRMLHDGACPLCSREVRFLRKRDKRDRIVFEDIADPAFDPTKYGLTAADVEGKMHGVLPDGTVVTGVEVFRRAYRAIGYGWLVAPTGWPVLRWVFDGLYWCFAKIRPYLGRFGGGVDCPQGSCGIDRTEGERGTTKRVE